MKRGLRPSFFGLYIRNIKYLVLICLIAFACLSSQAQQLELVKSIYPNPAQQWVVLETTLENSNLTITNASGDLVEQRKISSGRTIVSLEEWASGVYFFQLEEGGPLRVIKK